LLRHLTYLTALIGLLAGLVSAQAAEWPKSDIPSDPAVRYGVLANGMRYAILHNNTPAGAVSVRFAINAGAMQEAPDQRGLAHFVEHLAFRGAETDWQIWIDIGARPVPRKYIITSKTLAGAPQYTLRIKDWKTDAIAELLTVIVQDHRSMHAAMMANMSAMMGTMPGSAAGATTR